jgi:hypothetical protein
MRTFNVICVEIGLLRFIPQQQADNLLRRLKGKLKPNKEYPMILRRDVYRANTKLTPYWLKILYMGLKAG